MKLKIAAKIKEIQKNSMRSPKKILGMIDVDTFCVFWMAASLILMIDITIDAIWHSDWWIIEVLWFVASLMVGLYAAMKYHASKLDL